MPKAIITVAKELIAEAIFENMVSVMEVRDKDAGLVEMIIEGPTLPEVVHGESLPQVRAVITQHYRRVEFENI